MRCKIVPARAARRKKLWRKLTHKPYRISRGHGCDKRCAARATEKYSARPTDSIVIPEFLAAHGLNAPHSCRRLDADGERAAAALAQDIAARVDRILGKGKASPDAGVAEEQEGIVASCSCGSGIPVLRLNIAGKPVEIVGCHC